MRDSEVKEEKFSNFIVEVKFLEDMHQSLILASRLPS